MRITATTTAPDFRARARALADARGQSAEVFVQGERNVRLWRIHTSPEPRRKIPWRDPGFVTAETVGRIRASLAAGVNLIVRGTSRTLVPALRDAAKHALHKIRENLRGELHGAGAAIAEGVATTPLSVAYAARKLEAVGKKPILVFTGELLRSLRVRVVRGGP